MIDIDQALATVLAHCRKQPLETVALTGALFRTLATSIKDRSNGG